MTVAALPDTEPKQWKIPDTWLHHDARSKRPEQIKATMLGQLWKHAEICIAALLRLHLLRTFRDTCEKL
jgi:hypothetical protein